MPKVFLILIIFFILVIMYLAYEYFEIHIVRVVRKDIDLGLKKKIVYLADFHNTGFGKRFIDLIKAEKPDAILIGGDMINKKETAYQNAIRFFDAIKDIAPVVYSLGNHEIRNRNSFYEKYSEYVRSIPENVIYLDNGYTEVNGIPVSAISLDTRFYQHIKGFYWNMCDDYIIKDIPKKTVMLCHTPEYPEMCRELYDPALLLSGHLHGGHIRLPFVGGIIYTRKAKKHYSKGYYEVGGMKMYVTGGAGSHFIPIRFNNRCEIVVLNI